MTPRPLRRSPFGPKLSLMTMPAMPRPADPIMLPGWIRARLGAEARSFLTDGGRQGFDFRNPPGELALAPPDSVSWQIFKNPLTLFIGGVTAVLLELSEPRVRTGVWEHTTFRTDPVRRLKRTGLAAMITFYGARSRAEAMIAGVTRMHERVRGVTPCCKPYSATDPELLDWVNATASYGFLEAYSVYARELSEEEMSRGYGEGETAARLYGAVGAPCSAREAADLFQRMRPKLEPSPIIFEFLGIMRRAPIFPYGAQLLQGALIRAAIEILPPWSRELLGLGPEWDLRGWERRLVRMAAQIADRTVLDGTPPVDACLRLGLPADYLFRK
jgi:uncharacterized protein (DUF2236 family)